MTLNILSKVLRIVVISALLTHLTGCVMLIAEAVTNSWPTFEDAQKQWPSVPATRGRIIIFWPGQSAGSVGIHGTALASVVVLVNDKQKIQLTSNSFVFADLPPGNVSLKLGQTKLFSSDLQQLTDLDVNLTAGATTYVRINFTPALMQKPAFTLSVVEPQDALGELRQTHHNYKNPKPFDAPKASRGAALGGDFK